MAAPTVIRTANDLLRISLAQFCDQGALHTALWRSARIELPPMDAEPVGDLTPEVNHGRWIVFCPDCTGAEDAWEEERFLCVSCGAGWYRAPFPADRKKIEAVLLARPDKATRNWQPGETVDDLKAENKAHGLKVRGV